MKIKEILQRDPFRDIEGVIKITDHDPVKVWKEMDEYVPTEGIKDALKQILDTLLDTRRGVTERVCVWVSGFFGSGKSHFLKVLGYLLEDRELKDENGTTISSQEFLCRKLGFENYIPILKKEFNTKVLFINLLDCDPTKPEQSTISRLILRSIRRSQGLSVEVWVGEWEKEFIKLGKWEEFQNLVRQKFNRPWEEERKLHSEVVLKQLLPILLSERYRNENEAEEAIQESKIRFMEVNPSTVISELVEFANQLDNKNGRVIILLDEVGLYIGDNINRLTDLNSIAEQVVQFGKGKILLIASAQEALTDLVPRLTRDNQILGWLRDRFQKFHLEPTEVQQVVAERLLLKTPKGVEEIRKLLQQKSGTIRSALIIDRWQDGEFIANYPFPPYVIRLIQNIMGSFHTSIEDARRLSGHARSVLQLVHTILKGEGGLICGADQNIGWLAPLDLFFDALRETFNLIRSQQLTAFSEIERLGDIDGLPLVRIAKVLFLLQQISTRSPCTVENLASALFENLNEDINVLKNKVQKGLQELKRFGWVIEEEGKFRLLTPEQHTLEQEVNRNYPTPAELQEKIKEFIKNRLARFKFEFGEIRRELPVKIAVDEKPEGEGLKVVLYTPLSEKNEDMILQESIAENYTLFWKGSIDNEIDNALARSIAIEKTLDQWRTRNLSQDQIQYKDCLERELHYLKEVRLNELINKSFLKGKLFKSGVVLQPRGESIEGVLKVFLKDVAKEIYIQFIDKKPGRDEDCASILTWRPGSSLPSIYTELNLLTSNQQINRDNEYLSIIKGEILSRQNRNLERSGRALIEHFEKPPYGWDPRLVRLFVATLVKSGIVAVRYQNRLITDPTDSQLRRIFTSVREFNSASFEILPEVDWRKASELCSEIFGIRGGDTFEQTASIIKNVAQEWKTIANQLAVRCQDNELPLSFVDICDQISSLLEKIAQSEDPNTCLRRFLENELRLKQIFPTIKKLKEFNFQNYRTLKFFIQTLHDWAETLRFENSEIAKRWECLKEGLNASDIFDRLSDLQNNFAILFSKYQEDYIERHKNFQKELLKTIQYLRDHSAFEHHSEEAEKILSQLDHLRCDSDGIPSETEFVCPRCSRRFGQLTIESIKEIKERLEKQLEGLLPSTIRSPIYINLSVEKTLNSEEDLETILNQVRRYFFEVKRPIKIKVYAEPIEE